MEWPARPAALCGRLPGTAARSAGVMVHPDCDHRRHRSDAWRHDTSAGTSSNVRKAAPSTEHISTGKHARHGTAPALLGTSRRGNRIGVPTQVRRAASLSRRRVSRGTVPGSGGRTNTEDSPAHQPRPMASSRANARRSDELAGRAESRGRCPAAPSRATPRSNQQCRTTRDQGAIRSRPPSHGCRVS